MCLRFHRIIESYDNFFHYNRQQICLRRKHSYFCFLLGMYFIRDFYRILLAFDKSIICVILLNLFPLLQYSGIFNQLVNSYNKQPIKMQVKTPSFQSHDTFNIMFNISQSVCFAPQMYLEQYHYQCCERLKTFCLLPHYTASGFQFLNCKYRGNCNN